MYVFSFVCFSHCEEITSVQHVWYFEYFLLTLLSENYKDVKFTTLLTTAYAPHAKPKIKTYILHPRHHQWYFKRNFNYIISGLVLGL